MPYSGEVDQALVAKLLADAPLLALMTDGVWWDLSPHGKTKVVIVRLMEHAITRVFDGRAYEVPVYLVKAVALGTSGADVKAAAVRIDVLFDGENGEGGTVTVAGYGTALTALDEYVRYTEADPDNADARWNHRGGLYSVFASPT